MEVVNREEGSLEEVKNMKGSSSESYTAKDDVDQSPINEGGDNDGLGDECLTGNPLASYQVKRDSDKEAESPPAKPVENGCLDRSGFQNPAKDEWKPADQTTKMVFYPRPQPTLEESDPDEGCKCCDKCCIL